MQGRGAVKNVLVEDVGPNIMRRETPARNRRTESPTIGAPETPVRVQPRGARAPQASAFAFAFDLPLALAALPPCRRGGPDGSSSSLGAAAFWLSVFRSSA